MKSPFKFLDPYGPQDREAFFGREAESRELYQLVTKNRLTFVYGPSGTGKTSLVQCGLASRFGGVDWLPIFVRRAEDINASLRREVGRAVGEEGAFEGKLQEAVEQLFHRFLRPVYLIFDQFEELFILGASRAEQQAFYQAVAELTEADLPCRILFIMREDYFGHLNEFEKAIPELYHRKLRVEPMSRNKLLEVVTGSCSVGGIGFDDPALAPDRILDNMLAGKSSIHMPYVQVYLHMLFQEAVRQQGGAGKLSFSGPVIDAVGPITDVLGQFLKEQESGIFNVLRRDFPDAPEDIVRQALDVFVTEEGTKSPVLYSIVEGGRISLRGKAAQRLAKLPPALLSACLLELEKSRILRRLDDNFELAHDTLAQLVDQQRSAEQRQLLEISRRIEAGYQEHLDSGGAYFFTGSQLARIEPYLDKIAIEPAWAAFLEKSREEARRLEEARVREAQEKLKRQRIFSFAIGLVALLALAGGFLARRNARIANTARQAAGISALAAKAWDVYRDDHTLALRLAQAALELDSANADARQTLDGILSVTTTSFYQTVFSGHRFEVTALDFSPDNQLVASGSYDNSVRIWQRDSGVEIGQLDMDDGAPSHTIWAARFHPDGQSLFCAAEDGRVIHLKTDGIIIREFQAHRLPVLGMDLSHDGALLATAGADSIVAIWSAEGQRLATLKGHANEVKAVAFSADGRFILSGSIDGTARLWTVQGLLQHTFRLGSVKVNAVAFAPDGKSVLFGCSDHTARLFSLNGEHLVTIGGHTAEVAKVKFSPDGRFLITASEDHTARMWSLNGEEILKLVGHPERLSSLAISSDGEWIATGSFDFTAKVWNVPFNLGSRFSRHIGPVLKVAVSPDGQTIISGGEDNTVKLWGVNGALLHGLSGHQNWASMVAASPDGQYFLSSSGDGSVKLWGKDGGLTRSFNQFPGPVSASAISPDGQRIAAACGDEIWLYGKDGALLNKWKADPGGMMSLVFSPDGQSVLAAGKVENAIVWTLDGMATDSILTRGVPLYFATFTPDGKQVITVGTELPVRIWNRDGSLAQSCYGHLMEHYHVVCSPDGSRFATSSWDKTARIWSMDGEELQVLHHPDGVYGSAFMEGGAKLVTACRDKLIRIWEVRSGKLLRIIGGQTGPSVVWQDERIAPLAAIPFNPSRYSIDPDAVIQIFAGNPDNLAGLGGRYLAQAEELHFSNLEKGLADFNTAEVFYLKAREAAPREGIAGSDSLLATLYQARANLYLSHHKLPEFLAAAKKGLAYRKLPMLIVFEALGQAIVQPSQGAMDKALEMARDTVTACVPCDYATIGQVMVNEVWFYAEQLGIQAPGLQELVAKLEEEGLY